MKPNSLPVVCALLCSLLPCASFAAGPCYTVYGKDNVVVYRSEEPPIDMSHPIHRGMAERFPNGHLVMQAGVNDCPRVLPKGVQSGGFGLDDSPALKLQTPFTSVKAEGDGTAPASKRKRSRKPGSAPASAVAEAPQGPGVAATAPSAAGAPTFEQVADGGAAAQGEAGYVASYRRSDGRVVASYSRSAGGQAQR